MITTSSINRTKRVIGEIAANIKATSPGPWYMSHGHVISPGKGQNTDFDIASQPHHKSHHTIYGLNTGDTGRNDMRYIATVEPVRMTKLVEDVGALLAEREDISSLCELLDDLINNTMGGNADPRAAALGEAVEAYLSSAP